MIPVLVGVAIGLLAVRLAAWWRDRPRRTVTPELCCRCNAEITGSRIHTVTEHADDDHEVIDGPLLGGGTAVSADFCAGCCPGGCSNRKHAKLAA